MHVTMSVPVMQNVQMTVPPYVLLYVLMEVSVIVTLSVHMMQYMCV